MTFIKDLLIKLRYSVILLVAGVLMLLLGQYTLSGALNKLQVQSKPVPSLIDLMTGWSLILVSILLSALDYEEITGWKSCKLKTTNTGFSTTFRDSELYVDFGALEKIYTPAESNVLVLPANEFFDNRCLNDVRTAAGAFIRSHFDNAQSTALGEQIRQRLQNCPNEDVQRKDSQTGTIEVSKSYGTGTCVYLEHPLGTPYRLIFAAVATDRAEIGLRTEMASIFEVLRRVHGIVANQRAITTIYLPLLGAGKGGVPAQLAFRALTIAALEARCAAGGHAIREIHIVVYKPETGEPKVSLKSSKKAVRELVTLYQESAR